ncbi:MAG: hypothetical protein DSY55_03290, partial [Clostridia bacterium]
MAQSYRRAFADVAAQKQAAAQTPAKVPVEADSKKFREEIVRLEDGTYTNIFIPIDGDTAPVKKKIAELDKTPAKVPVEADTRKF